MSDPKNIRGKARFFLPLLASFFLCACGSPALEGPGSVVDGTVTDIPPVLSEAASETTAAESVNPSFEAADITALLPYSADLDGDGETETVDIAVTGTTDWGGQMYGVRLIDHDGTIYTGESDIWLYPALWLADMDSDGHAELFLTGDIGAEDAVTRCWYCENGLNAVLFAGDTRPAQADSTLQLSGGVAAFDGNTVLISARVDMLGAYFGTRAYAFSSGGSLAPVDGSVWDFSDNTSWLETIKELPVSVTENVDGVFSETVQTLPVGTEVLLLWSDGVSMAGFRTGEEETGLIYLTMNEETWGWLIDGTPAEEYFALLPYAE